ncbi:PIG-L deacetylase family protein [Stakelama marina]|nr:PIG-L deacetylase family protein [Stakelama marina]
MIVSWLVLGHRATRRTAVATVPQAPIVVEPVTEVRPVRKVLAIGAHPDDIEFGCAATLSRYKAAGYSTRAVVMTRGETGRGAERARGGQRQNEARDAAAIIKLDSVEFHKFPDGQLSAHNHAVRQTIEAEVQRLKPDIVLTHTPLDRHMDHRQVFEASNEACRHVPTLLCYENPNTPAEFRPNVFIDASPYIEQKLAALGCHFSQSDKPYFSPDLIRSIARVRGNQAQLRFAEGFFAIRVQSEAL